MGDQILFGDTPIGKGESQTQEPEPEQAEQPRLWQTNEKNHNVSRYNTRHRFPLGHICNACQDIEDITPEQRMLLKSIYAIHGVDFANLDGYTVIIGKGEMFKWKEIRPIVESLVTKYLKGKEQVKDGRPSNLKGFD